MLRPPEEVDPGQDDAATREHLGGYAQRLSDEVTNSAEGEIAGLRAFTGGLTLYGRTR